uniref:Uncharacterized protein n=1 Tax=Glossina brevipalpis TaxID=37001 RepID=A0A1A9W1N1_9MUSC
MSNVQKRTSAVESYAQIEAACRNSPDESLRYTVKTLKSEFFILFTAIKVAKHSICGALYHAIFIFIRLGCEQKFMTLENCNESMKFSNLANIKIHILFSFELEIKSLFHTIDKEKNS